MPFLKQILKPELFNSTELANRILQNLGYASATEKYRLLYATAVQVSLDAMVSEGILSCKEKLP